MEEPFSSVEEYIKVCNILHFVGNGLFDKQASLFSGFTRLPGGQRLKDGKIKNQNLLKLKKRLSHQELNSFLDDYRDAYQEKIEMDEYKSISLKQSKKYINKKKYSSNSNTKANGHLNNLEILINNHLDQERSRGTYPQLYTRCPHCEDNNGDRKGDNLSIKVDEKDSLIHCFAGCTFIEIFAALIERYGDKTVEIKGKENE
jgi:hypothetical protein